MANVGETEMHFSKPTSSQERLYTASYQNCCYRPVPRIGLFRPGYASALKPRSHSTEDEASMPEQRPSHFCLMCKPLNGVRWGLQIISSLHHHECVPPDQFCKFMFFKSIIPSIQICCTPNSVIFSCLEKLSQILVNR